MGEEKRILLVDDEAAKLGDSIQEMLNTLAADSGPYRVDCCMDYDRALSMLDGVKMVLVGVDLTIEYLPERYKDLLPGIDEEIIGYRLIRHIKEEYPGLKTIALATFSGCEEVPADEEDKARAKGAHGFIAKPFRAMDLVEKIRSL